MSDEITLADIHPDALYKVGVPAKLFGLKEDTVYRMGALGILPCVKVGPNRGRTKWRGSAILEYAERMAA